MRFQTPSINGVGGWGVNLIVLFRGKFALLTTMVIEEVKVGLRSPVPSSSGLLGVSASTFVGFGENNSLKVNFSQSLVAARKEAK